MPPIRMKGDGRKAKDPKKTIARLLSYLKPYKGTMALVVLCILLSSLATALSSYSLDPLINNYILPLTGQENPNYLPLIRFLVAMGIVYVLGIVSSFLYNYLMVRVGQGTQKRQCASPRAGGIARHVLEQKRDRQHHQLLDLFVGQTCLSGNRAD